jgi:hypothetical protein
MTSEPQRTFLRESVERYLEEATGRRLESIERARAAIKLEEERGRLIKQQLDEIRRHAERIRAAARLQGDFEQPIGRFVSAPTPVAPPRLGEFVLFFLYSPDKVEGVLGDFNERFVAMSSRFGRPLAITWYWWQITRSASAFVLGTLGSVLSFARFVGGGQ